MFLFALGHLLAYPLTSGVRAISVLVDLPYDLDPPLDPSMEFTTLTTLPWHEASRRLRIGRLNWKRLTPRRPQGALPLVLILWLVGWVLTWPAVAETPSTEPVHPEAPSAVEGLDVLLQRIESQRAALTTLRATVRERKTSPLLLEPKEVEGTFFFVAPDRARWNLQPVTAPGSDATASEGAEPGDAKESTAIVLDGDTMLTWYQHLNRVERLRLEGRGQRMMQFFGPGSSLEDLRRYFDFRFTRSAQADVPYRLELLPRNRRVARRVRHVTLDIDRQLFVPVYVRYEEASGASTEYWFRDLESNVEIDAGVFELDLPEDVEAREIAMGGSRP